MTDSRAEDHVASHTPGPWHFLEERRTESEHNAGVALTIASPAFDDLAAVFSMDDSTVNTPREEAIANARLIAAAPDMAAALKRALSWLSSYPGGCSQNAYMDAVNALKKAGCYD